MNLTLGIGIGAIILYFIIKLIESFLHDFKYVFFLSGKSILKAIIVADIYAIFNNHVVKAISTMDIVTVDIITIICISLSIWASMTYSQKNLKEHIYTFEITTKFAAIKDELKPIFKFYNIPYEYSTYLFENDKDKAEEKTQGVDVNKDNEVKYHKFLIHAFTKAHSKRLEDILTKYDKSQLKYLKTDTGNYKE